MRPHRTMFAMLALALASLPALAQQQDDHPGVSLTVYSTADPAGFEPQRYIARQRLGQDPDYVWQVPGFGVVKEVRPITFERGTATVSFTDVAEFIDPTTVSFVDLENPGDTTVLEQQFKFDLVSPQKLLENYLDREITVLLGEAGEQETITGKLLSASQERLVLQTDRGVRIVPHDDQTQIQLGELPGGLTTRPTLVWLVSSDRAGERPVRTTYQTAGLTWRADYNLLLGEDDEEADLSAWVTLMNLSGASYDNARLKLIAGEVHRVEPQRPQQMMRTRAAVMEADQAAGFEEQPFFEYHLYSLPRRTDVGQNTTQQITLFPTATDVETEKVMVYYGLPEAANWGFFPEPRTDRSFGTQSNKDVDVYIRFQNEEKNNLGRPLPRGKIRVYKQSPNGGGVEFVGEDLIDHTPKDEEILVRVGQAFDVVGERTQTDYRIDARKHEIVETFRIELRNHKEEPVDVLVKENLYRWVNWEIVEASDDYKKIDARTIHFPVKIPADGEEVVTYTVRYSW